MGPGTNANHANQAVVVVVAVVFSRSTVAVAGAVAAPALAAGRGAAAEAATTTNKLDGKMIRAIASRIAGSSEERWVMFSVTISTSVERQSKQTRTTLTGKSKN